MPSLKDLRNRIRSVRSTQKITSAMKVVAASRLRRAVEQVEAGESGPHYHDTRAGQATWLNHGGPRFAVLPRPIEGGACGLTSS